MNTMTKRIEEILEYHDVDREYVESFPLNEIDFSERNDLIQFRVELLDNDLADTYGIQYLEGDPFPAMVLWRNGWISGNKQQKAGVVDGRHRGTGAVRVGISELPAFVIDCDVATRDLLATLINVISRS